MKTKILFLLTALAMNFSLDAKTLNVLDYGAKGDGATLDTAAIQRAIDAAKPGEVVLVPRGNTFLVATLQLKGGLDFRIDGTLLISTNQADYAGEGVLLASNTPDLTISGTGQILGQSLSFMTAYD